MKIVKERDSNTQNALKKLSNCQIIIRTHVLINDQGQFAYPRTHFFKTMILRKREGYYKLLWRFDSILDTVFGIEYG